MERFCPRLEPRLEYGIQGNELRRRKAAHRHQHRVQRRSVPQADGEGPLGIARCSDEGPQVPLGHDRHRLSRLQPLLGQGIARRVRQQHVHPVGGTRYPLLASHPQALPAGRFRPFYRAFPMWVNNNEDHDANRLNGRTQTERL